MHGHVTAPAVWNGSELRLVGGRDLFLRRLEKLKPGIGEAFTVRVEREAEAWRHSDVKHLFGHIYRPVEDQTGITKTELHLLAKGLWMPDDGRTSITELNREELRAFMRDVEAWLREECWEAYEVFTPEHYEQRKASRRRAA